MWQKMVMFSYCIGSGALKHWNKPDPIFFLRPRGTILLSDLRYVSKKRLNKILDYGPNKLKAQRKPENFYTIQSGLKGMKIYHMQWA